RFEEARGGTLFLDEIGDMPFDLQTRLLRVLADGSFYRVGGSQAIRADVRIIAATHQPLEQRVVEGRFREDLFHRLNVIRLRLPPLRERKEDIPELARLFLRNSARDLNVPERQLSPEALEALTAFDYPGNIRQLENFCQWLTVMSSSRVVELKDLPPEVLKAKEGYTSLTDEVLSPGGLPPVSAGLVSAADAMPDSDPAEQWRTRLREDVLHRLRNNEPAIMATLTRQFEEILITTALEHSRGRRVEAAMRLGIGRNTLTRKCNELEAAEARNRVRLLLGRQAPLIGLSPLRQQHFTLDESRHKRRGRGVVQGVGRIPLQNPAAIHDADAVGNGKGLGLVVSD